MKTSRTLITLILVTYTLLALAYSIASPPFEVSDELWHYPMVKYIADNGNLPIQNPDNPGPWRQEGSQPPLYYMISAALTFWIDTDDMDSLRRINPHADIGVVRQDGNANMMVHRPLTFADNWRGPMLAVRIARAFSTLLGLGTVWITYQLGRELFPDWHAPAIVAASLLTFLPMFLFIHGSVNNDALSNFLGNLITLLLVRLLLREQPSSFYDYAQLGLAVGAGLIAKGSIGFMVFVVAFVLLVLSIQQRDWKPFIVGGLISGGLTNLIAAWWYIRNWRLYDDPTGLNVFLDTVGRRLIPANAQQLWAERNSFLQAYWGFFGGVNVPFPDWVYIGFNTIGGLALLSGIVYLIVTAIKHTHNGRWWMATSVTLVWTAITFISYLQWTSVTPASQGRLMFVALSSISLWMAVGLTWPLKHYARYPFAGIAVGYFAAAAIFAPILIIRPAYTPPAAAIDGNSSVTFNAPDGGAITLLRAGVQTGPVQPSENVQLRADWRIDQPLSRDWSLFIHLVTPDGVIIAQRDVYPGRGLLATSDLIAGQTWQNPAAVNVPAGAYAPSQLDVTIGWYHLATGERMTYGEQDRVKIGTIELIPREAEHDYTNPIRINFDNRIELIGFEYSTLTPKQGDEMTVTLYWRALEPLSEDFVIFVHIIDTPTFTIVGGSDAQPAAWTRPTSTWEVGEIITDTHTFRINEDALPTPYELEIGMYTVETDGSYPRLRVVTPDGGMANDYAYLSRVRVLPDNAP